MPETPPDGYQRIIPYLHYRDAPAAIDFLREVFGFEERLRMPGGDGKIGHAEVSLGGNVVMLATAVEEMQMSTPNDLGKRHGLVLVYVDDADAHCEHARAGGATIVQELEDKFYGDRSYGALDPEGHFWFFATHVRDVSEEELRAQP